MRTRIIGKRTGFVHFTNGNILHGRRREQIQWNQFIIRIRRSNRQSIQRRRTIPVTQSADNQLPGLRNRNAGDFLHALFHGRYTFDAHLLRTDILYRYRGHLPFLQQRAFAFQILTSYDRHFVDLPVICCHQYGYFLVTLTKIHFYPLRYIGNILRNQDILSSLQIREFKPSVNIRYGTQGRPFYLHRGTNQRFVGRFVDYHTFQLRGLQAHSQEKQSRYTHPFL